MAAMTRQPYVRPTSVSVDLHMADVTEVEVKAFPARPDRPAFVCVKVGEFPCQVDVLVDDPAYLDRLIAAAQQARQELAELLGLAARVEPCSGCEWCTQASEATEAGGSLWDLHDDPEYNLAHSHSPTIRTDPSMRAGAAGPVAVGGVA